MTADDRVPDGPLVTVEPDGRVHLRLADDPSVRLHRAEAEALRVGLTPGAEAAREVRLHATLHGRRFYGGALDGRAMTLRVRPGEPCNTVVAFDGDTPVAGWDLDTAAVSRLHDALRRALA